MEIMSHHWSEGFAVPSIDLSVSSVCVSIGLGGLGFRGGKVGTGGSALSLDMEREGPAVEPRDPG